MIVLCLGEKEGHPHVCTCGLHLCYECVGGGTGGANVVDKQDALALEVGGVYLHVALRPSVVSAADMHFLAIAYDLDMLEAVDCPAHGAHVSGKPLVAALVGLLTTGRDADYDGVCQVHSGEGLADNPCSPLGRIPPSALEVEKVAHGVLRVEVCTAHVPLRNIVHNGIFEHIGKGLEDDTCKV